jgi:dTDP-4-amino-4,6-dideoxygalactose transaminase
MPVQLNGRVANMDDVCAFASEHELHIVEDSCQAVGAKFKGQAGGTFGLAGTASFFPAKTLGCFGDGGAIFTNHDEVANHVRMLRDHGRGASGKVEAWGFNSRLDNVQAAILNVKLSHYNEDIALRRKLAALYQQRLGDMIQLHLPPAPDADPDHFDIYQNYEIEAEDRDGLKTWLADYGVGTILQWGGFMIHQFDKLEVDHDLPFTQAVSQRYLLLPMHTGLVEDDINYICDVIEKFYKN